jgi:hypothetical protein
VTKGLLILDDSNQPNIGEIVSGTYEDYFSIMLEGHEDPNKCFLTFRLMKWVLIAFKYPVLKCDLHLYYEEVIPALPACELVIDKKPARSVSKNGINQSYEYVISGGGYTHEYTFNGESVEAATLKDKQ